MDLPPGMSSWVTILPMMSSSKEKLSSMSSTSPSYLLMKVNDLYKSGSKDGNSSIELIRGKVWIKLVQVEEWTENCGALWSKIIKNLKSIGVSGRMGGQGR